MPLGSDYCIDPTLCRRTTGRGGCGTKTRPTIRKRALAGSPSLHARSWKAVSAPGVSKLYGEGPKVFRFQNRYWMLKDPNNGLDVYRSDDLEKWTYQGKVSTSRAGGTTTPASASTPT